jgi:triphosphoribosyl-dephospho-CoA synthetase
MNYSTMQRSIEALRPFFYKIAVLGTGSTLPSATQICKAGVEAEKAMLDATQGVNTHRGALFSLGLTTLAASHLWHNTESITADGLQHCIMQLASEIPASQNSHGGEAVTSYNVDGALAMAKKGYASLFKNWLPLYRSLKGNPWQCHITLLHIIAELDDTNVIHRCGYDAAQEVKQKAIKAIEEFTPQLLDDMNRDFIARNISPGGAADMLSLTIFVSSITNDNNVNI